MDLTPDQRRELSSAIKTVVIALLDRLEAQELTTAGDFEEAISADLNEAYGEFLDRPLDPTLVADVADRMAKLAASRTHVRR